MSKRRRADVRLVSEIEPASEPLPVSEDTPFVIGVLGNFAGRWASDAARGPSVADRPPLEVDRDNFDEIMKRLDVRFDASVDTNSGPEDEGRRARLLMRGIESFHPDEIAKQIEPLRALLSVARSKILQSLAPLQPKYSNG